MLSRKFISFHLFIQLLVIELGANLKINLPNKLKFPWGKKSPGLPVENRTLDEIYQAALNEGGRLIVYAGGDQTGQLDGVINAFTQRFPNMTVDAVVDYSKWQAPRINMQLAAGRLIPDVVQLQAIHEFPRWKARGLLMNYKPAGWDAVYKDYKDADGAYTGILTQGFATVINTQLLPNEREWPREARDILRPEFKNMTFVYPTDDDAILFWFKQVVDAEGWEWVTKLVKQEPRFERSLGRELFNVETGASIATFAAVGSLAPENGTVSRFILPRKGPFTGYALQATIFKQARHPEAAKLWLNWFLDVNTQTNMIPMWSVRTDVPAPPGFKQLWKYKNARGHKEFLAFMSDRAGVEEFRTQISFYLGETQGPPLTGHVDLYAERNLPH